jgi:hypothetical protein
LRKTYQVLIWLETSGKNVVQPIEEILLNKGYSNSDDCPCVFIRKSSIGFCIISIYVDDLNIIGHAKDILIVFKIKDLGKIKFCLALQIEHLQTGILVY